MGTSKEMLREFCVIKIIFLSQGLLTHSLIQGTRDSIPENGRLFLWLRVVAAPAEDLDLALSTYMVANNHM